MFHSDELKYLRADVRVNCEKFLALCKEAGVNVKVTHTVRDDEYQRLLVAQGYAAKTATRPTFHPVKAGLAFDICKNVRGHEYDDPSFFACCGQIGKQVGFSWGGDWRSFPDRPHFQWDNHRKWSSRMILAGKYAPGMEEYMTQAEFNKMMDTYLAQKRVDSTPSEWAKGAWELAKKQGITDGSGPHGLCTREEVVALIERSR